MDAWLIDAWGIAAENWIIPFLIINPCRLVRLPLTALRWDYGGFHLPVWQMWLTHESVCVGVYARVCLCTHPAMRTEWIKEARWGIFLKQSKDWPLWPAVVSTRVDHWVPGPLRSLVSELSIWTGSGRWPSSPQRLSGWAACKVFY